MRALTAVLICLSLAATAAARTITVSNTPPADFTRIQDAIDDANDGDTVEIQPGTYSGDGNRDIAFTKKITVRSIDPNDPQIVAATIINCNGTEDEPHRAFYFHDNDDPNSIIAGLTIVNGHHDSGGAIYLDHCAAQIISCSISRNVSDDAAIYCYYGNPSITDCVITDNYTSGIETPALLMEPPAFMSILFSPGSQAPGLYRMMSISAPPARARSRPIRPPPHSTPESCLWRQHITGASTK